eukprot:2482817-Rhodomonas_salina.2
MCICSASGCFCGKDSRGGSLAAKASLKRPLSTSATQTRHVFGRRRGKILTLVVVKDTKTLIFSSIVRNVCFSGVKLNFTSMFSSAGSAL